MNISLLPADTLQKVRKANCLTEAEMQLLAATVAEMQVRRELDTLDFEWENKVSKYVKLHRHKGGREHLVMTSWDEVLGGTIIGICLVAWGAYMLWQFSQEQRPGDTLLAALFFAFITALGAWMIFRCRRVAKVVEEYDEGRSEYLSKRKDLTQQLPEESRFPVRYCPNCLSRCGSVTSIQAHHRERQSIGDKSR